MGRYDSLVPGSTGTATAVKPNRYASFIPKAEPMAADNPASLYNQANPKIDTSIAANLKATIQGAVGGFNAVPVAPKTFDVVSGVGSQNALTAAHDAWTQGIDKVSNHIVEAMGGGSLADLGKAVLGTVVPATKMKPLSLEQNVALGRAALGTINAGFGVLLSPFSAYATVPVLGNVYDGVNKIFGTIGGGGGASLKEFVHQLPIEKKTKDLIEPLAEETGALVAMVAAGKVFDAGAKGVKDTFAKISDNSKTILDELSKDPAIQEAIQTQTRPPVKVSVAPEGAGETKVPISTPATKHAAYAESQGYEPYVPERQLPVIDMGAKPRAAEPMIQAEPKRAPELPGYRVEPIKPQPQPVESGNLGSTMSAARVQPAENGKLNLTEQVQAVSPKVPVEKPLAQPLPSIKIPATQVPERPVIGGERATKAASDIGQKLVDEGQAHLTPEQVSTYEPGSYKADKATVASMKIEDAVDIARGRKPMPETITYPQILFNAVEAHAIKTGNFELLKELAKSKLGTELSEAGGTLGSHGFNDNPNSPVKIMRDVSKERGKRVEKRIGKPVEKATKEIVDAEKKSMMSEIKKSASKRPTWEAFIKDIRCGY